MSDAIKIAKEAPKYVVGLLTEMFAANAEDNRVCLGGVHSGQQYIQIQLVVTSNPAALMDEGDADDEADEAESDQPKGSLYFNWLAYRAEFDAGLDHWPTYAERLALGSIRAIYWLAFGQGETPLATEIGDWWKEYAPLHGLGEIIR